MPSSLRFDPNDYWGVRFFDSKGRRELTLPVAVDAAVSVP